MGKRIRVNGVRSAINRVSDDAPGRESSFSGALLMLFALAGAIYFFIKVKKARVAQTVLNEDKKPNDNSNEKPVTTGGIPALKPVRGAAEFFGP